MNIFCVEVETLYFLLMYCIYCLHLHRRKCAGSWLCEFRQILLLSGTLNIQLVYLYHYIKHHDSITILFSH